MSRIDIGWDVISSEYVDWGGTYYTQVSALIDDEELGLPSDIQVVNIDSKPGMNEKTAISVTLPEGSTKPKFEIIFVIDIKSSRSPWWILKKISFLIISEIFFKLPVADFLTNPWTI